MSLVESTAAFFQRCDEITSDDLCALPSMHRRSKITVQWLSPWAHLRCPFGWAIQLAGSESVWGKPDSRPNVGHQAHSLWKQTLVVSTIKEKVTSDGAEKGDATKRIPLAEKKQRREDQLARLSGITMTGELDPSHMLLDLANQIHESGVIVWLAPSKCSKRDDEVQMSLKDSKLSVQVENSQLKVGPSIATPEAHWDTELKFQWCMMRRGLALDQCRVLSWHVHQHRLNYMLNLLGRPVNPGFQSIKIDHLVRADREMWTLLAQEVTGGLKMQALSSLWMVMSPGCQQTLGDNAVAAITVKPTCHRCWR